LWRASGVFTGTTNSPGGMLRQSSRAEIYMYHR
jgi:hypothetical protein